MGEMNFIGGGLLTIGTALTVGSFFTKYTMFQAARELAAGLGRSTPQIISPVNPFGLAPGIMLGAGLVGIVGGTAALLFNE
ncbi:hypothetical protein HY570_00210 [Candidatus Micrarchaeota archaeon]|nr:hypothetical protein [Candidatus Micrarchaeota archaeon]